MTDSAPTLESSATPTAPNRRKINLRIAAIFLLSATLTEALITLGLLVTPLGAALDSAQDFPPGKAAVLLVLSVPALVAAVALGARRQALTLGYGVLYAALGMLGEAILYFALVNADVPLVADAAGDYSAPLLDAGAAAITTTVHAAVAFIFVGALCRNRVVAAGDAWGRTGIAALVALALAVAAGFALYPFPQAGQAARGQEAGEVQRAERALALLNAAYRSEDPNLGAFSRHADSRSTASLLPLSGQSCGRGTTQVALTYQSADNSGRASYIGASASEATKRYWTELNRRVIARVQPQLPAGMRFVGKVGPVLAIRDSRASGSSSIGAVAGALLDGGDAKVGVSTSGLFFDCLPLVKAPRTVNPLN